MVELVIELEVKSWVRMEGRVNDNGERLVELCEQYSLKVTLQHSIT